MQEFENQPFPDQEPSKTQHFIDAIQSVEKFNNRHAGIAGVMVGMIGMFMRMEDESLPVVDEQDEAAMARELVALIQTDELAEMGITLFDPDERDAFKADAQDDAILKPPSRLWTVITDPDKFEMTLSYLEPNSEQREGANASMGVLLSTSASLIAAAHGHFESDGLKQHALRIAGDQIEMFAQVSPLLVEKGFGDLLAFNTLAEYAMRHDSGTLGDYLGAKKLGLLYGEGEFGPASWQKDATPEYLTRHWESALTYLKSLRDREEPSSYYTELFDKLRSDYDIACQSIMESSKSNYHFWTLRKALENIGNTWNNDFQLENSFYLAERVEEGYEPFMFDPSDLPPQNPQHQDTSD